MSMDDIFPFGNLYIDERLLTKLFRLVQDRSVDELKNHLSQSSEPLDYLTTLVHCDKEQISLLMLAALRGDEPTVRHLLSYGEAGRQISVRGTVKFTDGVKLNGANALYCACFGGHFHIAQILIDLGQADVNDDTDDLSSHPLLLQATVENRIDIIRFLIENQYSDVNQTRSSTENQRSALMLAASRNYHQIVQYLIKQGADLDYISRNPDTRRDTALRCAAAKQSLDSLRLLWKAGADPNITKHVNNPLLKLVVQYDAYDTVRFLLEESYCKPDDLELCLVTTFRPPLEDNERQSFVSFLKISLQRRQSTGIQKSSATSRSIYDYQQECQTIDELDAIADNDHQLLLEYLLIMERLCSSTQPQTLTKALEKYAHKLSSAGNLDQAFDVCIRFAEVDQGESGLKLLVWILCQMLSAEQRILVDRFLQAASFALQRCNNRSDEMNVHNALFLVIIATNILRQPNISKNERELIYRWMANLCKLRPTTITGETLLHICVTPWTSNPFINALWDIVRHIEFPNQYALQLLLTYGSRWLDIDARDCFGDTPLHIACRTSASSSIIQTLYDHGCHIDCVNNNNETPLSYCSDRQIIQILQPKSEPTSLKCLCAHLIAKKCMKMETLQSLNPALQDFVALHSASPMNTTFESSV